MEKKLRADVIGERVSGVVLSPTIVLREDQFRKLILSFQWYGEVRDKSESLPDIPAGGQFFFDLVAKPGDAAFSPDPHGFGVVSIGLQSNLSPDAITGLTGQNEFSPGMTVACLARIIKSAGSDCQPILGESNIIVQVEFIRHPKYGIISPRPYAVASNQINLINPETTHVEGCFAINRESFHN